MGKVVTAEAFEYYVDHSSANAGGDDCLFMNNLDHEDSEDDEIQLPPESFGCTQETNPKVAPLMATEFSSLVGGGEIDIRGKESLNSLFAEKHS